MAKRGVQLLTRQRYFPDKKIRVAVSRQVRQSPMGQHRHEFFEIAVVLSGSGVHVTDHFRHRIEARDVLVLHSRRAHGYERTEDLNLINIMIRADLMERLGRELRDLPGYHSLFTLESVRWHRDDYISHLRLSPSELAQLEEWTDRLEEETHRTGQGGSLLAEAHLTLIIGMLCRCYGRKAGLPVRSEGRFGRILSWIEKNLDRSISVSDLAREMGMSERTLHRQFSSVVGTTPANYLMHTRIRRAAEQLSGHHWEKKRISDVAAACGFEDSNYFSRCFRQVIGKTPRQYRNAARIVSFFSSSMAGAPRF